MSTELTTPPPAPDMSNPSMPWPRRHSWLTGIATLLVFAGLSCSASGDDSSPEAPVEAVASPTAEEAPEPEVITETIEVEVVPEVCLDALDRADALGFTAADGFIILGEAFEAYPFVVAELEATNDRMLDMNSELEADIADYATARDACRDAAG